MNTLNTETHSSKEIAEFSFEDVNIKSILLQREDKKQTSPSNLLNLKCFRGLDQKM